MRSVNADQKIALASVISGGGTAIVAIVVTGLSGWRDRAHQRSMAEKARKQARLADAYVSLLEYSADYSRSIRKFLSAGMTLVSPQVRSTVDHARQDAVIARVEAYGSDAVTSLVRIWLDAIDETFDASWELFERRKQLLDAGDPTATDSDYWRAQWEEVSKPLGDVESRAREALKDQVAAELK